jgi:hypothetical protein
VVDTVRLGEQGERLVECDAVFGSQRGSAESTLRFLSGDAVSLSVRASEVGESAELALAVGVIADNESAEVFAANVTVVSVDFYGNVPIPNDVRPRFRQANGFLLG